MASKLRISDDLLLPPDYVTSTGVIYGGKGMGKTNLGSVIIEELTKAGLRWALLDPMGVSWGLRHSKDGKGPGVKCVILGGAHGDIPIEPTGGAIVADLVVDETVNTIIDFSRRANGQMWTTGEKIRFVTDYTLRLFQRQGELVGGRRREPLMQILDEAARYIPQSIPSGAIDIAKCVGAWEQVCEEGRNIGLGVTFITQRSARMNKSVSELADVMFAFRTIGPNSLDAIMDWLGSHVDKAKVREIAASIRELDIGQALVVSPGWLKTEKIVRIRHRETFDSSYTPRPGETRRRVTGRGATPDLATYQAKMVASIEAAKANDPKELQKVIVDLRRQLAAKPTKTAPAESDVRATLDRALGVYQKEIKRVTGGVVTELRKVSALLDGAGSRVVSAADDLGRVVNAPVSSSPPANPRIVHVTQRPAAIGREPQKAPPRAPEARQDSPEASGNIGGTPQKIINALLFLETIGTTPAPRAAIAALLGIAWDTGTFRTYVSRLRSSGLIRDGNGLDIALTDAGRDQASRDGLPETQDELHAAWLTRLGGTESKMLRMIIDAYPDPISREAIGTRLGISPETGTFRTYLSRLRSPGLIIDDDGMALRASDNLFPRGLR